MTFSWRLTALFNNAVTCILAGCFSSAGGVEQVGHTHSVLQ
jgi:hypothetical protein